MNQDNSNDDWQQRMYELEEKNGYQKLSSSEIEELKALHNKYCEINMKKEPKSRNSLILLHFQYGARRGIRTPDPLHVTEML